MDEACRLDILTAIGSGLDHLKTSGLNAVVRSAACEYKAPIKLSDTVQIQCFIKKLGKASVNFGYNFINATSGKLAGTGEVSVVFINNDTLRPVKIPEILLSGMKQFISSNE
jgi:YbgC/YbaW family acyl-CoA thioester hydrolase